MKKTLNELISELLIKQEEGFGHLQVSIFDNESCSYIENPLIIIEECGQSDIDVLDHTEL